MDEMMLQIVHLEYIYLNGRKTPNEDIYSPLLYTYLCILYTLVLPIMIKYWKSRKPCLNIFFCKIPSSRQIFFSGFTHILFYLYV